ncbi:MAG: cupin domain-containing protein [Fibrobacter sp.]|nr:cupin domain-containing protein [Fibrobacter sp.]
MQAAHENKPIDPRLLSNPFSYKDLVSYQEGAVVSRTIIDKIEGTVTVFAFDKDQKLSTHSAPYDALLEVIDGSARITIEEQHYTVNCGQQIIMPANKPHAVFAPEQFKMTLIMIRAK